MSRSWIRGAGTTALVGAVAQRDPDDNSAVIDAEATSEFLERANSVVEQVMSYDYRDLQANKDAVAEPTTGEFQESRTALFAQTEAEAPAQQLVLTSTAAAREFDRENGTAEVLGSWRPRPSGPVRRRRRPGGAYGSG